METKNALQALIENGGWRPIEEMPNIDEQGLFKSPVGLSIGPMILGEPLTKKQMREVYQHSGDWPNIKYNPTHFMYFSDVERMAKIIGVMMEALSITSEFKLYKELADVDDSGVPTAEACLAKEALQQCQKIAEGE